MDWIDQARKQRKAEGVLKYGRVHPKEDPRCFRKEMVEELLDALNYGQWGYEKGELSIHQYLLIQRDIRRLIKLFLPCTGPGPLSRAPQEGAF